MTNSDWYAEVEGKSAELPSSDLFGGELFGDELIDIYNAAVGDGENPETHENEIPSLPHQNDGETEEKGTTAQESHPGAQVAATAAAIDDGLGAFRPSTSFNDLTTLLPSSTDEANEQPTSENTYSSHPGALKEVHQAPAVASNTNQSATAITATKRKANAPSVANKAQKSGTATTPSSIASSAVAVAELAANAKAAAGTKPGKPKTPDPLSKKPAQAVQKAAMPSNQILGAKKAAKTTKPEKTSSAPVAAPSKSAATEADFKTVAQAAVSNLIQSTKTGEVSVPKGPRSHKVDTSTAHIKALTGNNWVAACSDLGAAAVAAAASSATSISSADSKANAKPKRQNMTADERARQNRDRNREHARNTRLRKKAYVEELKRTLTELVAERERTELERRQSAQREVEQREVRFRVIEEFLKLRARNETSVSRWAAILADGFSLTLPATNFLGILKGEIEDGQGQPMKLEQVLSNVPEIMAESNNFAVFLNSLGKGDPKNNENVTVGFVYHCDRANFFMDDSNAVLDWSANSVDAVKKGASTELSMRGSIRASFCPASNKLRSANIVFDSGAICSQLHELSDIPNEVDARAASNQADAILDSLQMPHLDKQFGCAIAVVPQGDSSDEGH